MLFGICDPVSQCVPLERVHVVESVRSLLVDWALAGAWIPSSFT